MIRAKIKYNGLIFLILLFITGKTWASMNANKAVVGIASNFSAVTSNSYNPMGSPFRNGVLLAMDYLKKNYK